VVAAPPPVDVADAEELVAELADVVLDDEQAANPAVAITITPAMFPVFLVRDFIWIVLSCWCALQL
jgi:hypothetical protein